MSKPQIRPMKRIKGRDLANRDDALQSVASDYHAEMRRLRVMHGRDWHRREHNGLLVEIERRIKRHTRRLAVHPKGWKLPCWCAECVGED